MVVALLESLLWTIDYVQYNQGGRICMSMNTWLLEIYHHLADAINVIGALLTAGKMTIIRTLILLVALGYSITTYVRDGLHAILWKLNWRRPILEQKTKLLVIVLTAAYGIGSAISEYLWVWKTMGVDIPVLVEAIFLGFTSVLNVIYLTWVRFFAVHLQLLTHFRLGCLCILTLKI